MRTVVLAGVVMLLVCVVVVPPAAAERAPQTLSVGTSPLCAYHTIAGAIAAAQPGDTIKVQAAIFDEPELLIDTDLTLIGGYASADPYGCLTQTGVGRATYRTICMSSRTLPWQATPPFSCSDQCCPIPSCVAGSTRGGKNMPR